MKTFKYILLILSFVIVTFPQKALAEKSNGEPVPGAEIYIELEPDDEPIANLETNNDGEFVFMFPEGIDIPKKGIFTITIIPPKKVKGSKAKNLVGMKKQTIQIPFTKKDGPKFKYILTWKADLKAENKGAFAVSGKNST